MAVPNIPIHAKCNAPQGLKLRNMDEKNMHNLFLKNMSGLIEEAKNPSKGINPWVCQETHKKICFRLTLARFMY